jgi:ribosomal-protein-alanine N-acetyltransferase
VWPAALDRAPRPRARTAARPRVALVAPGPEHAADYLAALTASRARFDGFVDPPASELEFRAWCQRARSPCCRGRLVRSTASGELVGAVALGEIEGGAESHALLSCYGFAASAGRGLVTEAAALLLSEGFRELGLGVVRAEVRPENSPSRAMLARLGFEALAEPPVLRRVGGAWAPHATHRLTRGVWQRCAASERV